jgi:hypothetical protein
MAVTVAVAIADHANLHKGTAPNHRDGVGIIVAEVEVLQTEGGAAFSVSPKTCL